MNTQQRAAALSADLRRISYWIYGKQDHLVRPFLRRDQEMAKDLGLSVGRLTLQDQLENINAEFQDETLRFRAADRALTASRILWYLSQRWEDDVLRETV